MCGPIPLMVASGAMMAAGTAAQMYAQNQRANAYQKAIKAEQDRQAGYTSAANAVFADSAEKPNYGDVNRATVGNEKDRIASSNRALAEGKVGKNDGSYLPAAVKSEDPVVKRSGGAHMAGVNRDIAEAVINRARLYGFDDSISDVNRSIGKNRYDIGVQGSLSRNSMNVLPLELKAASNKASTLSMLGDLGVGLGHAGISGGFDGMLSNTGGASNVMKRAKNVAPRLDSAGRLLGGI